MFPGASRSMPFSLVAEKQRAEHPFSSYVAASANGLSNHQIKANELSSTDGVTGKKRFL